jgi:hypothetical protein
MLELSDTERIKEGRTERLTLAAKYQQPRARMELGRLSRLMKQLLLATCAIMLVCVAALPQQRSGRESAGIEGPVRTVRIEGRQLHAVAYQQWGVMVYTLIDDDKGRVLEDAEYMPGGNPDIKTTAAYDERGNEIEHAHYIHDGLTYRSTTRYDARNRKLEELTFVEKDQQTSKFIFQYEKDGKQIWFKVQPDGKRQRRGWATLDDRGHPLERLEFDERGAVEHRYVYTYDAVGNKTSDMDYYQMEGRTHSSKNTYVYNDSGDLIEEGYYPDGALHTKKTYKLDPRRNKTRGS